MKRRICLRAEKRNFTSSRNRQAAVCPRVIRPAGALLIELLVAGALLGMVISATIPTLGWLVRQRTFSQQRQAALLEVGNLMERLTALDWNDLTPERAAQFKLSEPMEKQLSSPLLTIAVDTEEDAAKHVLVQLGWEIGPGRAAPPVRLAAWVYRQGEEK